VTGHLPLLTPCPCVGNAVLYELALSHTAAPPPPSSCAQLAGGISAVPLLGFLGGYALDMLAYVARQHFYISAS
jgi:hypothetical protein